MKKQTRDTANDTIGFAMGAELKLEDERSQNVQSENVQQFTIELQTLCQVKAEEFHLLGYDGVTAQEIWQCAQNITKGNAQLHQLVEAILSLNIGKFMTHATINAYQGKFGEEV